MVKFSFGVTFIFIFPFFDDRFRRDNSTRIDRHRDFSECTRLHKLFKFLHFCAYECLDQCVKLINSYADNLAFLPLIC